MGSGGGGDPGAASQDAGARVSRGGVRAPPRARAPARAPAPRTVRVRRSPHLGLGISVTGGREHGVPILISELEAGGPAALTGELYVGDAILAINEVDLTQACHKEAVQALQSVKGDCALCVQFIATDDDDRLSEDNYRFPLYPEDGEVFGGEQDGSGATPTAPRTPDYNRRTSDAGSVSECESDTYRAPPPAPYPDYNNINNNLNILDMDDDSIKIEARLEWSGIPRRSLREASSGESAASTPVHARPHNNKKKRKPQDWRTKGAYRPVEVDAPSSDEPQTETPSDNLPPINDVPESPEAPAPPVPPLPQGMAQPPLIDIDTKETKISKPNGDIKPLRRESKGFRIGSARRVTDGGGPLLNGEAHVAHVTHATHATQTMHVAHATHAPQVTHATHAAHTVHATHASHATHTSHASRGAARLLAGDGDPDFGTPV
ncbi:unnamed protein product [Chrysodeixis includens]|uniref:PDZ domain-containing protein n=1 Tax=Chrysodeixis includens TaxID=689277 RepID=A0A9N8KTY7_CHRIL|nr:unnamed protein product [Chrysodeixis includens]